MTSPHADRAVHEIAQHPEPLAIVFGSEKTGCSPAIEAAAHVKVTIPTIPAVESLNVSAAASITLYSRARFNGVVRA